MILEGIVVCRMWQPDGKFRISVILRPIFFVTPLPVEAVEMAINKIFAQLCDLSNPPKGSVNVMLGKAIKGPGGRWIPCATQAPSGTYYSGLFRVGPGERQLCARQAPSKTAKEALSAAIRLAESAAA